MKKSILPFIFLITSLSIACKSQGDHGDEPITVLIEEEDYDLNGSKNEAEDVMKDVLEDLEEEERKNNNEHSLDGTSWLLKDSKIKTIQLKIADGKINLKSACIFASYSYLTHGDSIYVKQLKSNHINCNKSQQKNDSEPLKTIDDCVIFKVEHGKLSLVTTKGKKLMFYER